MRIRTNYYLIHSQKPKTVDEPFNHKKSLGQNFLIDANIAKKIVKSLECKPNDLVLEIGAGTGALTKYLLSENIRLTALEIDRNAVRTLLKSFPDAQYPTLTIFNEDVLIFDLKDFVKNNNSVKLKIIGNIPYNISSQIFFWMFNSSYVIDKALLMIQKELAERLVASRSTKQYGILTIALSLVGEAKILFHIPPTCFFPPPKVYSSIVLFQFFDDVIDDSHYESIMSLVRAAFNQRRKTLRNSLKQIINKLTNLSIDEFIDFSKSLGFDKFEKRAEELLKEDYILLDSIVRAYKKISS